MKHTFKKETFFTASIVLLALYFSSCNGNTDFKRMTSGTKSDSRSGRDTGRPTQDGEGVPGYLTCSTLIEGDVNEHNADVVCGIKTKSALQNVHITVVTDDKRIDIEDFSIENPNSDEAVIRFPLPSELYNKSFQVELTMDIDGQTHSVRSGSANYSTTEETDSPEETDLSMWTGNNNISIVGTVTSGTWHGSAIENGYFDAYNDLMSESKIGTGSSQIAAGDHVHSSLFASNGNTLPVVSIDSSGSVGIGGTGSATTDLRFNDANNSNYVGLKAPSDISQNKIWTLPSVDGTSNQLLKTDGSATLGWANFPKVFAMLETPVAIPITTYTTLPVTKVYDTANAFNDTTHTYTPTVAGYYLVMTKLVLSSGCIISGAGHGVYVFKNGVHAGWMCGVSNQTFDGNQIGTGTSCLLYMNGTTDYLDMRIYHSCSNPATVTYGGYFQATLLP